MAVNGILLNQSKLSSSTEISDKLTNILLKKGEIKTITEESVASKEITFDSPIDIISLNISNIDLLSITLNNIKYTIGSGNSYSFFNYDYIFLASNDSRNICYLSNYIYGYMTYFLYGSYITPTDLSSVVSNSSSSTVNIVPIAFNNINFIKIEGLSHGDFSLKILQKK